MSKHLFGLIATPYGAAANNRGENEGNITTLQKILWKGDVHTTVSAEAIRWALRYYWEKQGLDVNRRWNDETYDHEWRDQSWAPWTSKDETVRKQDTYIDDDVLGFMLAEAANTDGSDELDDLQKEKKRIDQELKSLSKDEANGERAKSLKQRSKELASAIKIRSEGTCDKRRGALEVTRAISLSPFVGDITFNAKSGTKTNTSLYGTEVHATRYQYGIALTPSSLRDRARAMRVVEAVINLREVGGNHSRFLFDFSPSSVILRWTDDFAPRMLYGFDMSEDGKVTMTQVLKKVKDGDINSKELFIGGEITESLNDEALRILEGACVCPGVKAAAQKLVERMGNDLALVGAGN
ncbi:MAG TPA: DevR family CRISPR-associated autoregulator [Candidatus Obscuribacterales bacterium]